MKYLFVLIYFALNACATAPTFDNVKVLSFSGNTVTISQKNNTCFVTMQGVIKRDFIEAFSYFDEEVTKRKCTKKIAILAITGGEMSAALTVGLKLRLENYDTLVPNKSKCDSACSFLFIAGNNRYLEQDANTEEKLSSAQFGLHRIRVLSGNGGSSYCLNFDDFNVGQENVQIINKSISYAKRMLGNEIGSNFIKIAQSANCDELKSLSYKDLINYHFATEIQKI